MKFQIGSFFKSIDLFGHPIKVNYKGQHDYKSLIGGVFSILAYSLTLVLIYRAVKEMIIMDDPVLTEFTKPLQISDRKELVPVIGSDYDFIFMVSPEITSRKTLELVSLAEFSDIAGFRVVQSFQGKEGVHYIENGLIDCNQLLTEQHLENID